jgi:hypothetical protein
MTLIIGCSLYSPSGALPNHRCCVVDEDHLQLAYPMQGAHQLVGQLFERGASFKMGTMTERSMRSQLLLLWPIRE